MTWEQMYVTFWKYACWPKESFHLELAYKDEAAAQYCRNKQDYEECGTFLTVRTSEPPPKVRSWSMHAVVPPLPKLSIDIQTSLLNMHMDFVPSTLFVALENPHCVP